MAGQTTEGGPHFSSLICPKLHVACTLGKVDGECDLVTRFRRLSREHWNQHLPFGTGLPTGVNRHRDGLRPGRIEEIVDVCRDVVTVGCGPEAHGDVLERCVTAIFERNLEVEGLAYLGVALDRDAALGLIDRVCTDRARGK